MSRELLDKHLDAARKLVSLALTAEDPHVVMGYIHRAQARLKVAHTNAAIEAERDEVAGEASQ